MLRQPIGGIQIRDLYVARTEDSVEQRCWILAKNMLIVGRGIAAIARGHLDHDRNPTSLFIDNLFGSQRYNLVTYLRHSFGLKLLEFGFKGGQSSARKRVQRLKMNRYDKNCGCPSRLRWSIVLCDRDAIPWRYQKVIVVVLRLRARYSNSSKSIKNKAK